MKTIAYYNDSPKYVHIGATMVPPHETREVDASLVPNAKAAAVPAARPADSGTGTADKLGALLARTVDDVRKALSGLSGDELTELEKREAAAQTPRKGVLDAVAAEQLKRAAA
ncbi:hypothetical protein [Paraburkholderia adhaesiva]|uniref:hypothetical protein n=1 Tax=Paraburkholderia adhaesiva TaxID=2883244 RepID=UPI001F2F4C5A|nr:hypothetical protein [Paraburkholderia adhaesiva]